MGHAAPPCRVVEPEFDPIGYLREYYGHVGPENRALLTFHALAHRLIPAGGLLLEFGGGPVIYPLIAAALRVRAIHFAEHRADNREVVRRWLTGAPDAVEWTPFVRYGLAIERVLDMAAKGTAGKSGPIDSLVSELHASSLSRSAGVSPAHVGTRSRMSASGTPIRAGAPPGRQRDGLAGTDSILDRPRGAIPPAAVAAREALIRRKVTAILPCDAYRRHPLGHDARGRYDIVSMNFVAESIGGNRRDWRGIMKRITDLVRPGGALIMTALLGARYYAIGARRLPATPLTMDQITAALAGLGFTPLIARAIPAEPASYEIEPDIAMSWQPGTRVRVRNPPLEGVAPKEDCRVAFAGVAPAGTVGDCDEQEHGCHAYQGYTGIALYAGIRVVSFAPYLVRNRLTLA